MTELGRFKTPGKSPRTNSKVKQLLVFQFYQGRACIFTLKGRTKNCCAGFFFSSFFSLRVFPSPHSFAKSPVERFGVERPAVTSCRCRLAHLQEASKFSHRPEIAATTPIGPLEGDGQMASLSFCAELTWRLVGVAGGGRPRPTARPASRCSL